MLGKYKLCSFVVWEMIWQKSVMSKRIKHHKKSLTLCHFPDVFLYSELPLVFCILLFFSNFQFNSRTRHVTFFFIGYSRWEAGSGVLLKTRSFTLEIHLSSTLFECCLNILFPMQLLSFSVIGSVIQADCIKAISAKWNMCPVSAAHSLFIRLLTSETKPEKTKHKAVYGPMGWRSTRWCHPGDVLHVDLFWMLLTFPSPEGSTHLRVREKGRGVYDWKGKSVSRIGLLHVCSGQSGQTPFPQVQSR